MSNEDIIICRCNDANLKEIEELIDAGVTNIEMITRRVGLRTLQDIPLF